MYLCFHLYAHCESKTSLYCNSLLPNKLIYFLEFKQKEETTVRCRNNIQASIQEDPWNLPLRIKNLVEIIQKYVEGL